MISKGREHHYSVRVRWTGNAGTGTSGYRDYKRDHEISTPGKPPILGSSDPVFRGDPSRYNPEDLLVATLSACHMLWYLHLCADAGITVTEYLDDARGTMVETAEGGGQFSGVTLQPQNTLTPGANRAMALHLHEKAHHLCFIANSVNFPVHCHAEIRES